MGKCNPFRLHHYPYSRSILVRIHIDMFYGTMQLMDRAVLREKAVELRRSGKTYSEIQRILGIKIPKGTLSYWLRDEHVPPELKRRIKANNYRNLEKARELAVLANKRKREMYLNGIKDRNQHIPALLKNNDTAKLILAMLFFGEGSKSNQGSLMIGNSDPNFIRLFLSLLRQCYALDEKKFRCTLQCRADQNIKDLEEFWSKTTEIPLPQFYHARVDPRTEGRPTRKVNYKGVCRVDYFSADIYNEMRTIVELVNYRN